MIERASGSRKEVFTMETYTERRTDTDWGVRTSSWAGLNVLTGIWLIISPFVVGFSFQEYGNEVICGALVLLFALARLFSSSTNDAGQAVSGASGLNAVMGLWLIISTFVLGYSFISSAMWNAILSGIAVLLVASTEFSGQMAIAPQARPTYQT
jgi:hypothetical protein